MGKKFPKAVLPSSLSTVCTGITMGIIFPHYGPIRAPDIRSHSPGIIGMLARASLSRHGTLFDFYWLNLSAIILNPCNEKAN
jgi:hypothetical protein